MSSPLTSLQVRQLKSLRDVTAPLAPLTIVAGVNSVGKSTLLQALLCLWQSPWDGGELLLNGRFVEIGTASDALYENASDSERIGIVVEGGGWSVACEADARVANAERLPARVHVTGILPPDAEGFESRPRLSYLAADRWGPQRRGYPIATSEDALPGVHGEFAPAQLLHFGTNAVTGTQRRAPDAVSDGLLHQTEAWLGTFAPGIRLDVEELADLELMRLTYSFAHPGRPVSDDYTPPNVGFGVSFALPAVVAMLAANPGDVVIVDSVESHLHPRAQASLARLAACAAADGVQVLLETHSDHVVNEARLSVKTGVVAPDDVSIVFVTPGADGASELELPRITSDGRLTSWPRGFLDEWVDANVRLAR